MASSSSFRLPRTTEKFHRINWATNEEAVPSSYLDRRDRDIAKQRETENKRKIRLPAYLAATNSEVVPSSSRERRQWALGILRDINKHREAGMKFPLDPPLRAPAIRGRNLEVKQVDHLEVEEEYVKRGIGYKPPPPTAPLGLSELEELD